MDLNQPQILPEDVAPPGIESCQSCELYQQRNRVIWGEGDRDAPVFVVLDNPGLREDPNGKPFICGTRETLQKAANEAGLASTALYVSYVLKCRPIQRYDKVVCREICMKYLWEQIQSVHPLIVVCLGNVACQSFFEDPEAEVKLLRGKVHQVRDYPTVVSYHPLAVRRRPVLYRYFRADWELVVKSLSSNAITIPSQNLPL